MLRSSQLYVKSNFFFQRVIPFQVIPLERPSSTTHDKHLVNLSFDQSWLTYLIIILSTALVSGIHTIYHEFEGLSNKSLIDPSHLSHEWPRTHFILHKKCHYLIFFINMGSLHGMTSIFLPWMWITRNWSNIGRLHSTMSFLFQNQL